MQFAHSYFRRLKNPFPDEPIEFSTIINILQCFLQVEADFFIDVLSNSATLCLCPVVFVGLFQIAVQPSW